MSEYNPGIKGPRYAALIDKAKAVPFESNAHILRSKKHFVVMTHNAVDRAGVERMDAINRIFYTKSMSMIVHEDNEGQYVTVNDMNTIWLIKITEEKSPDGLKKIAFVVTSERVAQ